MHMLDDMLKRLEKRDLLLETHGSPAGRHITALENDSREVQEDDLFVAIRGQETDGHQYIAAALEQGAAAVVGETFGTGVTGDAVMARVSSSRTAWAELSAQWFGDPSTALNMIGITGTNGKTTTAFLLHHMLTAMGAKSGLLGTIAYRIGDDEIEAPHTTPDAFLLNEVLRRMVDEDCRACVMEVSSHALEQARVQAIDFNVGIFTNLSREHLDYHPSFDAYRTAKKRLFDGLDSGDVAVYNLDDPAGPKMVEDTSGRLISYGQSEEANVVFSVLENRLEGLRLLIDGSEQEYRLVGDFNAYNLAAAYAAGRAMGYPRTDVQEALASVPPVPGRFEQFRFDDGTTVVVDFAHTPDALEHVLKTIRALLPSEAALWCVFGCGGDRDKSKRRMMGSAAEKFADRVIVTSDNPRTEEPESIMNDIRRGMSRPLEADWLVDRAEAIRSAAVRCAAGDVVLVAGKGHETYQIIGTERREFDDREEVRQAFGERTQSASEDQ